MLGYLSENGNTKYGIKELVLDTPEDLDSLPTNEISMGSVAFVISTSALYMMNSDKQWIEV